MREHFSLSPTGTQRKSKTEETNRKHTGKNEGRREHKQEQTRSNEPRADATHATQPHATARPSPPPPAPEAIKTKWKCAERQSNFSESASATLWTSAPAVRTGPVPLALIFVVPCGRWHVLVRAGPVQLALSFVHTLSLAWNSHWFDNPRGPRAVSTLCVG